MQGGGYMPAKPMGASPPTMAPPGYGAPYPQHPGTAQGGRPYSGQFQQPRQAPYNRFIAGGDRRQLAARTPEPMQPVQRVPSGSAQPVLMVPSGSSPPMMPDGSRPYGASQEPMQAPLHPDFAAQGPQVLRHKPQGLPVAQQHHPMQQGPLSAPGNSQGVHAHSWVAAGRKPWTPHGLAQLVSHNAHAPNGEPRTLKMPQYLGDAIELKAKAAELYGIGLRVAENRPHYVQKIDLKGPDGQPIIEKVQLNDVLLQIDHKVVEQLDHFEESILGKKNSVVLISMQSHTTGDKYDVLCRRHVASKRSAKLPLKYYEVRREAEGQDLSVDYQLIEQLEKLRHLISDGHGIAKDLLKDEYHRACTVGISVAPSHDPGQQGKLFVSALTPGGPAYLSGQVHVGDELVAVGGVAVTKETIYEALIGDDTIGSPCKLTMRSPEGHSQRDVLLVKASVTDVEDLRQEIRLFDELEAAIQQLAPQQRDAVLSHFKRLLTFVIEAQRSKCETQMRHADRVLNLQQEIFEHINSAEATIMCVPPQQAVQVHHERALAAAAPAAPDPEQNKQIESLEQQLAQAVAAADNYRQQSDSLVMQIDNYKEQVEQLTQQLTASTAADNYRQQSDSLVIQIDNYKEQVEQLTQQLAAADNYRQQSENLVMQIDKYREQVEQLTQQLTAYRSQCEMLEAELNELKKRNASMDGMVHKDVLIAVEAEAQQYRQSAESLDLQSAKLQETIRVMTEEMAAMKNGDSSAQAHLEAELIDLRVQLDQANQTSTAVVHLEQELLVLRRQVEQSNSSSSSAAHLEQELIELKTQLDRMNASLSEAEAVADGEREKASTVAVQAHRLQEENDILKDKYAKLAEKVQGSHDKDNNLAAQVAELEEAMLVQRQIGGEAHRRCEELQRQLDSTNQQSSEQQDLQRKYIELQKEYEGLLQDLSKAGLADPHQVDALLAALKGPAPISPDEASKLLWATRQSGMPVPMACQVLLKGNEDDPERLKEHDAFMTRMVEQLQQQLRQANLAAEGETKALREELVRVQTSKHQVEDQEANMEKVVANQDGRMKELVAEKNALQAANSDLQRKYMEAVTREGNVGQLSQHDAFMTKMVQQLQGRLRMEESQKGTLQQSLKNQIVEVQQCRREIDAIQHNELSMGRMSTPRASPVVLAAPDISPKGSHFDSQITVTITSDNPRAAIYGTTNGSSPGPSNFTFMGLSPLKLVVHNSTVVKAICTTDDGATSRVIEEVYKIGDEYSVRASQSPAPAPTAMSPPGKPGFLVAGIGILLEKKSTGIVRVKDLVPGGPAARDASICQHDVLLAIDYRPVNGKPLDVLSEEIKGVGGTRISLHFMRGPQHPNEGMEFDVILRREYRGASNGF